MSTVIFYVFGAIAVVSATLCILQRNPVSAALWLVCTMFSLAGIYVLLDAQFIAAIQVLVYAGAVMVLFLFVIMLLNLGRDKGDIRPAPVWGLALAIGAGIVGSLVGLRKITPAALAGPEATGRGSPFEVLPGGLA